METRKEILKKYREEDESYKFPINGRFNATERAIRRLRVFEKEFGERLDGAELIEFLEQELTRIVNNR